MTPRRKRMAIALGIVAVVGAATALVLNAFQSNLVFFLHAYPNRRQRGTQRTHISPGRLGG